ncbi:MAG: BatA domain-containing protein, partial [Planctomycetes bacterium]|nr:BatA domain-containing protein [Planctomycetota bacterium]
MTFLEPLFLAGLPLVLLPIAIHFFNQRRYRTIYWGAMMFLAAASRMSRGYARLRQWLILAARMLVIGALIFAISRPLAGGWLGSALGVRADSVIVLLDRSPSMCELGADEGVSKFEAGKRQFAQMLDTFG